MAGKNKPKKGTSKPSPYPLPRRSARRVSIESRAVTTENQDHGVVDAPVAEEAMTDQPMPTDNENIQDGVGQSQNKKDKPPRAKRTVSSGDKSKSTDAPSRKEFDDLKSLLLSLNSKIDKFVSTDSPVVVSHDSNANENANHMSIVNDQVDLTGLQPAESVLQSNNCSSVVTDVQVNQARPSHVQAASQLNTIIDEHIANIVDGPVEADETGETDHYISIKRPIDYKVPLKIKNQIWANEFIDLGILLSQKLATFNNTSTSATNTRTFELVSNDSNLLQVASTKSKVEIASIEQWSDAFLVYLTIYCEKFPHYLKEMTTYMSMVQVLAHRKRDYLWYDQEFRYGRSLHGGSWKIDSELWLIATDNTNPNYDRTSPGLGGQIFRAYPENKKYNGYRTQSNSHNSNKPRHPKGYCYKYHSTGECIRSPCPFKHNCYLQGCQAIHPVFKCKLRGNAKPTSGNVKPSSGDSSKSK